MDISSTDEFKNELQVLEDEKNGILDNKSKSLFERIRLYLIECQKNQCVLSAL